MFSQPPHMNGVYKRDQNGHKYITVLFLQLLTNLKLLSNNNNFLHTYIPLNKEYKRDMIQFDIILDLVQEEKCYQADYGDNWQKEKYTLQSR